VATAATVLAVVVLSPFLLSGLTGVGSVPWTRLSEIGQTYGAISAVLSALALGGVAVSLFIQARQARASEIQAVRGYHLELVRLQLDDLPTYLPCWGPLDLPGATAQRRHIYTNLMFAYGSMGYGVGEISEPLLRNMLAGMFRGEFARRYWVAARGAWVASAAERRRGHRFVAIVDDEHRQAVAAGPPALTDEPAVVEEVTSGPRPASAGASPGRGRTAVTSLLLGAGAGALIGIAVDRWQRGWGR
jgi:hypothetical protein